MRKMILPVDLEVPEASCCWIDPENPMIMWVHFGEDRTIKVFANEETFDYEFMGEEGYPDKEWIDGVHAIVTALAEWHAAHDTSQGGEFQEEEFQEMLDRLGLSSQGEGEGS